MVNKCNELNEAPKMEEKLSDKFELENFRSTVPNKSELVVCLYLFS